MRSTSNVRLPIGGAAKAAGTCLIVMMPFVVCGQDSADGLQFEAASVRLHTVASPSTGRSGIEETPGLIRIENLSLKAIIEVAYGVRDFQIGGPGWLDAISVDITAKPQAGYKHEHLQPLLRYLLADRFKLVVHRDSKDVSGFALVIAKSGPKVPEATQPRGFFTVRPGLIACTRVTSAELARALARMVGRPVVDRTGLAAAYDVRMEWTPDQAPVAPGGDDKAGPAEPGLTLFAALQDQLGLRLQTEKVPIDTVIVDHVEKAPTEN